MATITVQSPSIQRYTYEVDVIEFEHTDDIGEILRQFAIGKCHCESCNKIIKEAVEVLLDRCTGKQVPTATRLHHIEEHLRITLSFSGVKYQ